MLPKARCNLTACALSFYDGFSRAPENKKPRRFRTRETKPARVRSLRYGSARVEMLPGKNFFEMLEGERFP